MDACLFTGTNCINTNASLNDQTLFSVSERDDRHIKPYNPPKRPTHRAPWP